MTQYPGPLPQSSLLKQLLPHVVDEPGAPAEYLSGLKYALVRHPMDCSVRPSLPLFLGLPLARCPSLATCITSCGM